MNPAPGTMPDSAQRQIEAAMLAERMGRIARKLLVLSGKGGVGKSTVAVNLAVALAAAGRKVGLLDVDVHGPSIPKLMGLEGRGLGLEGDQIVPVSLTENLSVMSVGFMLPEAGQAVIWRGPRKYGLIRQFLKDVAWGALDCLVVDSPPGTGDEPLAVAQLVGAGAEAVIVTTPQDLAVADVRRCVSFCRALSLPVAGIVENMSGYVCPRCGERVALFKTGGGEALAAEAGVPFLARIPLDPRIVEAGDAGTPLAASGTDGEAAAAFAAIVKGLTAREEPSRPPEPSNEENHRMKIAIPIADSKLSVHFGHCEQFAVLEVDTDTKTVVSSARRDPPPHEPGALPRWLGELGVEVVIAGGMGRRAHELFSRAGIEVVVGAPPEDPEALAAAYLNGTLRAGENLCDH